MSSPAPPKTRADLEWDRVLSAFADRCASELGAASMRAWAFEDTDADVHSAHAEGREALALLEEGTPLSIAAVGIAFGVGLALGVVAARRENQPTPQPLATITPATTAARAEGERESPAPVKTVSAVPSKASGLPASETRLPPKIPPSVASPAPAPRAPPLFYPADAPQD